MVRAGDLGRAVRGGGRVARVVLAQRARRQLQAGLVRRLQAGLVRLQAGLVRRLQRGLVRLHTGLVGGLQTGLVRGLHLYARLVHGLHLSEAGLCHRVHLQVLHGRATVQHLQLGRHVIQAWSMMRVCVSVGRQGGPGSVGGCLLVLGVVHGEEVLELPLQSLEGGSLQRIFMPALQHDLVKCCGTILRTRHAVTVLDLM